MDDTEIRVVHFELCEDSRCRLRESIFKHLIVSLHHRKLRSNSATAISYTWGNLNRVRRSIGHDKSGNEVHIELGEEWDISLLATTLHGLCHQISKGTGHYISDSCWLDQLSILQSNATEVRETLAKIPDIYRTLDVVVLIPATPCSCLFSWLQLAEASESARLSVSCPNSVSYLPWTTRLWPRQEMLYASNIRVVWTSSHRAACPQWWSSSKGFVDDVFSPTERMQLSPVTRLWLSRQLDERQEPNDATNTFNSPANLDLPEGKQLRSVLAAQHRLASESNTAFINLALTVQLWRKQNEQPVTPSSFSPSLDALQFLTGKPLIVSAEARREDRFQESLRKFAMSMAEIKMIPRVATDPRDYVLSVWVDCPGYVIPETFRTTSPAALLQDAIEQFSAKIGVELITYTPPGLFGKSDSGQLCWQPGAYLEADSLFENVVDVYAPVILEIQNSLSQIAEKGTASETRLRRAKTDLLGGLEVVAIPDDADASLWLLETLAASARYWNPTEALQLQALAHINKSHVNIGLSPTEHLYQQLMRHITDVDSSWFRIRDMIREAGHDSDVDAYSIAIRIVGHSIGIPPDVIERKSLHLMVRPGTSHCPPLLGFTWRDIAQRDSKEESYPMSYHFCGDRNNCMGDDSCEDNLPLVIYEMFHNEDENGCVKRHIFGVWAPTEKVPRLPVER